MNGTLRSGRLDGFVYCCCCLQTWGMNLTIDSILGRRKTVQPDGDSGSIPLVPALCAESALTLRQESHFTHDHASTMEDATCDQYLHATVHQTDQHGASRCTLVCSLPPRHRAANSHVQAWLERKLVRFMLQLPEAFGCFWRLHFSDRPHHDRIVPSSCRTRK